MRTIYFFKDICAVSRLSLLIRRGAAVVFTSLFIVVSCFGQQLNRDELQKQQQQLLRELSDLSESLSKIRKDKREAIGAYSVIKRKIATREALVNNINSEIQDLDNRISRSQTDINRLKLELDTLKENYAKSIVFAYKSRGNMQYLNFLFSAESFNDAVKRLTYLKSYRGYREQQVNTIYQTQALLKNKIGEFYKSKEKRGKALNTQSSQLEVLKTDKDEQKETVKQLKERETEIAALIKKREKERMAMTRAIEKAIKRAREEAERTERNNARQKTQEENKRKQGDSKNDVAQQPNTAPSKNGLVFDNSPNKKQRPYSELEGTEEGLTQSINFEKNKGKLPWPISGAAVITGHFGKEKYGDTRLVVQNDGVLIATDIGTNIKCIADGVVSSIFPIDNFYAVAVQHGKYFTIYNKLATTNVVKGDEVKAGTSLGTVAANMDGQGEFELMVTNEKGVPLNPETWLKRAH